MANHIEDVEFNVDITGENSQPAGFLILSGDFVDACERYLADDDAESMTFQLDRTNAEKLVEQIAKYIFPQ